MPAGLAQQTKLEAGDFPASTLAEQLPLHCNTDDERLYANIQGAIDRGHDILPLCYPHDGVAVIVGGGPSVSDDVEDIRRRKEQGAKVFALNGAGLWLQRQGIVPDAMIVLDARAHNARFVKGLDRSVLLLLATQCDPAVFEAGRDHQILAWHPSMNGESGITETRATVLIGGSTTVGMRGLRIVHVLGFRQVHLYGYDSSYELGEATQSHAYAQPENDADALREVEVAGEVFYAPAWMIRQADDFRLIAASMIETEGLSLHVHGRGLLPTIAREMEKAGRLPNAACYDMARAPASFDFITWLIAAEMDRRRRGAPKPLMVHFEMGSEGDGFRSGDVQNIEEKQRILDHVMRPALALVGAVESAKAKDGFRYRYWYKTITQGHQAGEAVPRLKAPLATIMQVASWLDDRRIRQPIVITLREARYWENRNSNMEGWIAFAERRRQEGRHVVFVRDTARADEPVEGFASYPKAARDLWTRMALYSRASCNLTVSAGPATLLQFSDHPFIQFILPYGNAQDDPLWWRSWAGFERGEQFPWARGDQLTVWERDTADAIEGAWQRWVNGNRR